MTSISRRKFLIGVGATVASSFIAGSAFATCTEDIELVRQDAYLRKLPVSFEGYRIGLVTDIHLGIAVSEDFVAHAFSLLCKEQLDLLLLGGDYLWIPETMFGRMVSPIRNPSLSHLDPVKTNEAVFCTLSKLSQSVGAKDGVIAVYGNHDRRSHPTACARNFRENRIPLLRNQSLLLKRGTDQITLFGVDDYLTGIPVLPRSVDSMPAPRILLTHNPDYVDFLITSGKNPFDLALCGHTHGGQIWIPACTPYLVNVANTDLLEGWFHDAEFKSYTSRGLGVVEIPYRIGVRPEVTVFTLRRI